jgi:hypothetical protein
MGRGWKKLLSAAGWVLLGVVIGWLLPVPRVWALRYVALSVGPSRVVETTVLFQRMCTEILAPTPVGQHYLDLGYTYWGELVGLLWYDEAMTEQTWQVIELYTPAVEALLEGRGGEEWVSQEMVEELVYFLAEMEKRADPELREVIQQEREKVPWQELVGLTVEEAWVKLQGAVSEGSVP